MQVLLITQEPPFDAGRVVTGNALRTLQLQQALERGGHATRQIWLDPGNGEGAFRNADQLRGLIRSGAPGAILVSYWELLALLPYDLDVPVILDFVAPRPLESLFEHPETVALELHRLRANLARCDLLLVGNAEQAKLLAYWLLEAGFDLRRSSPVRVVPPGGDIVEPDRGDPVKDGWTLVGGGVSWPWRDAREYVDSIRTIERRNPERLRLVLFGGAYPRQVEGQAPEDPSDEAWQLAAWKDYSAFLRGSAHIGLELSAENVERRFSQSFRALDFLRHGLPLICNEWLPIAGQVEQYQAGWTVRTATELPGLLEAVMDDPGDWRRRSDNALRLARERLAPTPSAAALLEWLQEPGRAARLPHWGHPPRSTPVLGKPPWPERLGRRYRLARRVALNRVLGGGTEGGDGIVIITRGDLEPADHGAAVKIMETARGLSRNDREVAVVTDSRAHYWRCSDGDCKRIKLPAWLRLLARPLALVKLDHYTRDLPESNAFLYLPLSDGSFFWRALYAGGKVKAGVFQAEFPAYASPCLEAAAVRGACVVLVEHNVEYQRMRDQIPELTADQYGRLRAIEIELCNRSDAVVCVSDNDRATLAGDGVHPGLLHTIPHGIDLASFAAAAPLPVRERFGVPDGEPLLVYHGTFAYPPNRDALNIVATEILPRLERAGVRAHLLAVGHRPPREPPHPRIHCTGSVEDVAPSLKAADIAVIPLRQGGGTRMKIVEYFAAGLPVISTDKGIEGIPAVPGEHAIIANDWDGMCNAILEVLRDRALRDRLASAGRSLAEGLDWQAIGKRYLELYATLSRR